MRLVINRSQAERKGVFGGHKGVALFGVLRSFGGNEVIDYPRDGDIDDD